MCSMACSFVSSVLFTDSISGCYSKYQPVNYLLECHLMCRHLMSFYAMTLFFFIIESSSSVIHTWTIDE